MGMTAHITYSALDAGQVSTLSRSVVTDIIRDRIGFDGLLMTDDLSMKALSGILRNARKKRSRLAAILFCIAMATAMKWRPLRCSCRQI